MKKEGNLSNIMSPDSTLSTWQGTKMDFRQSWKLLRENYRAFIGTELFGFFSFLFVIACLWIVYYFISDTSTSELSERFFYDSAYRWISVTIGYIILTAFMNCQTGLAYDIMSSGEMYAEFKSSFSYFKQHWWKYVILSFLTGGIGLTFGITITPKDTPPDILPISLIIIIGLIAFAVGFFWYCLTIHSLASINAQGRFFTALRESFRIFRTDPKRIFLTWGLYHLIFNFPSFIFEIIIRMTDLTPMTAQLAIILFLFFSNVLIFFIGLPLRALIITGLYNNIPFQHNEMIEHSNKNNN